MHEAADFTMWALFARATIIVKFVMIALILGFGLVLGGDHRQDYPVPEGPARGGYL